MIAKFVSHLMLLRSEVVSGETGGATNDIERLRQHPARGYCYDICQSVAECRDCPHHHGSYCKTWLDPRVCFGLYYTDRSMSDVCYASNPDHPHDCPEEFPVVC